MYQHTLRVGAVSYLNTRPLIYQLEQLAPGIELVLDHPSRLADALAAGGLDVALIPSIELFSRLEYSIVSDACIACRGPVLSVKLFSRRPVEAIHTLALDEGSRTSATLVRVLLADRHGVTPELESLPVDAAAADVSADALLLIGDRAMHSPSGQFEFVWDLGDEWVRWTGLPFVFAMWVARAGQIPSEFERALAKARDRGVANLEEIASREAAPLGLTRPQCLSYLRDNLHFTLGPQEQQGLSTFYRHAARLGLASTGVDFGSIDNLIAR